MTDIQTTTLPFDWEQVEQEPIRAVLARGALRLSNGDLACDEIALVVECGAIILSVNPEIDEVIVSLERAFVAGNQDWHPLEQMADVVSHALGWCWLARNCRGYVDSFTLGLDGIDPSLSFIALGSRLWCARVTPISA